MICASQNFRSPFNLRLSRSSRLNVRGAEPSLGLDGARLSREGFLIPSRPSSEFLGAPKGLAAPKPPAPPGAEADADVDKA